MPLKIIAVRVEGVAADDLFVPIDWLFGRSLHIFGRRKDAGPLNVEVSFERDGKTESRSWTLKLTSDSDDMFVGRLWAQRKLNQLRSLSVGQQSEPEKQKLIAQIVALSQEWTLLSPHTAFLVLENEAEYPKYGIRRSARHKYWKPADAVAAAPLAIEALEMLKSPARVLHAARPITRPEFEQAALRRRHQAGTCPDRAPNRAFVFLESVAASPLAATSLEYKALESAARKLSAQHNLLLSLGPQRGWFERGAPIGFDRSPAQLLWQALDGYGMGANYDDPYLAALAKQVAPPKGEITIEEFIDWVRSASGLNVVIDKPTLREENVMLDQPLSLRGIRSMSIESMMKHVLTPVQATYVFEDEVLKITTTAMAADKLTHRIYPITDLILTTRATDYSLLANGALDRELISKRRLNEKLDRKISVEFDDMPLEDAFEFIGNKLNDNLLTDRSTLLEENVALDQPVTLKLRDLPIRTILKHICEPVQLQFLIENEAIIIATAGPSADKLETRFHPGQGIIYELPPELVKQRRPKPRYVWGWGFGGFGGMGGGFGGGGMFMGGMGGMGRGRHGRGRLRRWCGRGPRLPRSGSLACPLGIRTPTLYPEPPIRHAQRLLARPIATAMPPFPGLRPWIFSNAMPSSALRRARDRRLQPTKRSALLKIPFSPNRGT